MVRASDRGPGLGGTLWVADLEDAERCPPLEATGTGRSVGSPREELDWLLRYFHPRLREVRLAAYQ